MLLLVEVSFILLVYIDFLDGPRLRMQKPLKQSYDASMLKSFLKILFCHHYEVVDRVFSVSASLPCYGVFSLNSSSTHLNIDNKMHVLWETGTVHLLLHLLGIGWSSFYCPSLVTPPGYWLIIFLVFCVDFSPVICLRSVSCFQCCLCLLIFHSWLFPLGFLQDLFKEIYRNVLIQNT